MKSFKSISALAFSVLARGLFSGAAVPTAGFTMSPPGNPVVGQEVVFTDVSEGNPTTWSWNFGDGTPVSSQRHPKPTYSGARPFSVTLTASNADGSTQKVQSLFVSPNTTLRLDPNPSSSHAFNVTLTARDQRTGNTAAGQALPQNEKFGYFSLPALTGDPNNPEVFVKILDGTSINGQYWIFYGHLTDLIYDLTVTEIDMNRVKTYQKDAGNSLGGFDVSGFDLVRTVVNLVASDFRWSFDGGGPAFTFHVGRSYQLRVSRVNGTAHEFSGILREDTFATAFGCPSSSLSSPEVCNFIPAAADVGSYLFFCTNAVCGSGHSDPAMQNGLITVTP